MIDIIIRDCGYGEWLPIIVETDTGRELYRGSRYPSYDEAASQAKAVWDGDQTGNIIQFKREQL